MATEQDRAAFSPKPLEWGADYKRESAPEQDRSQMEAERNAAEDGYFAVHPELDYEYNGKLFAAGYERGWNERNKKVMELQARIVS